MVFEKKIIHGIPCVRFSVNANEIINRAVPFIPTTHSLWPNVFVYTIRKIHDNNIYILTILYASAAGGTPVSKCPFNVVCSTVGRARKRPKNMLYNMDWEPTVSYNTILQIWRLATSIPPPWGTRQTNSSCNYHILFAIPIIFHRSYDAIRPYIII